MSEQALLLREVRKLHFGAGADVGDDLGRGEAAELAGFLQVETVRYAEQEARGVEVAGARRVDDLRDRHAGDLDAPDRAQDDAALLGARESRELRIGLGAARGLVEGAGFVKCGDLGFIREQDVDAVLDERQELGAVAVNAEGIRQAERHLAARLGGDGRGLAKRCLGFGAIEQIPLEVDDLGRLDQRLVDFAVVKFGAHAEERVHGALAVWRHEDQAAARRRAAAGGRLRGEGDARGADVMAEDRADLIARRLADEGRLAAERGDARHGVGDRAAGDLRARPHGVVKRQHGRLVDQTHAPLHAGMLGEEGVVAAADDVDNGVSDADDVMLIHGEAFRISSGRELTADL